MVVVASHRTGLYRIRVQERNDRIHIMDPIKRAVASAVRTAIQDRCSGGLIGPGLNVQVLVITDLVTEVKVQDEHLRWRYFTVKVQEHV